MKNALKSFLFSALFLLISVPVTASGHIQNWEIDSFHSEIFIQKNGTITVTETIDADFTKEPHRGLERVIPYKYPDHKVKIDFINAVDEENNPWKIDEFRKGGNLFIQMRTLDDSLLPGTKTFKIKYEVKNVVNFFEEYDEFYWNVNGTEWVVPTLKTSATVSFEEQPIIKETKCFTGKFGSNISSCFWENSQDGKILFESKKSFERYENLSIALAVEKGFFPPPSPFEKAVTFIQNNSGLLIPLIVFSILFSVWYKKGRDEKTAKNTVMPHYTPPRNLLPSETGTLIDTKLDPRDITATIIDYAVKGYIKIEEIPNKKDYILERIKPFEYQKEYEKKILEKIFTADKVKVSSLKYKFHKEVGHITKSIIEQQIKEGYFPHNPHKIRGIYNYLAGGILIVAFNLLETFAWHMVFGMILTAGIVFIFGQIMPRRTAKGAEAYYELKGLYEYIKTAETDRMKFQEDQNILFEKLLPYAMAFGLIEKWTKAFEGILKEPPSWYVPYGPAHFSFHQFNRGLTAFADTTSSNLNIRSRSGGAWSGGSAFRGGGGFSGGGFGGGGGRGL